MGLHVTQSGSMKQGKTPKYGFQTCSIEKELHLDSKHANCVASAFLFAAKFSPPVGSTITGPEFSSSIGVYYCDRKSKDMTSHTDEPET
jgi:hypothetical protein